MDYRLIENLPLYARMLDDDGILEHIANAIQIQIDIQRRQIDNRPFSFNPSLAPANFLAFLGQFSGLANDGDRWQGIGINPDWPVAHMREVIKRAPTYWHRKGTEWGIREALALWLRWEAAHDEQRCLIHKPFGDSPTEIPPQWIHYKFAYGHELDQTWPERSRYGAGDEPQWAPRHHRELNNRFTGWYNDLWSDRILQSSGYPYSYSQGSGLAAQRPWMNLFVEEHEWNWIAPDIHALNVEIWNTHASPEVLLWLTGVPDDPITLSTPDDSSQFEIEIECIEEGFPYSQWWPYSAYLNQQEDVAAPETTVLHIYPGHGFNDPWNSTFYPTPENALYWVSNDEALIYELPDGAVYEGEADPQEIEATDSNLNQGEVLWSIYPGSGYNDPWPAKDFAPAIEATYWVQQSTSLEWALPDGEVYEGEYDPNQITDQLIQREELITLSIYPGHGFNDPWNSTFYPTPENALYWVGERQIVQIVEELILAEPETPETPEAAPETPEAAPEMPEVEPSQAIPQGTPVAHTCTLGEQVEIVAGSEEVTIPAITEPPNQLLEEIPGWAIAPLSLNVDLYLDVAAAPPLLPYPEHLWSYPWESPALYRFMQPIDIFLYGDSWNITGRQYYSCGGVVEPEKIETIDTVELVNLCNVFDLYSQRRILEIREVKTPLPEQNLDLFAIYPILKKASNLMNWPVMLETTTELTCLYPSSAFWSTSLGPGNPSDRAQEPSLDDGRLNLYLEYLAEFPVDTELLSYALYMDGNLIKARDFAKALVTPQWITAGLRFVIPFRLENGAASAEENWIFENYLLNIWRQLQGIEQSFTDPLAELPSTVDQYTQAFVPENLRFTSDLQEWHFQNLVQTLVDVAPSTDELEELPQASAIVIENAIAPVVAPQEEPDTIQDALESIQITIQQIAESMPEAEQHLDQVTKFRLTNGNTINAEGYQGTEFIVETSLGHSDFAVTQIRSSTPPYHELTRPEISIQSADQIRLIFWGEYVSDNSAEVWINTNQSFSP